MHSTTNKSVSNSNILIEHIYIVSEDSNIQFKQLAGSEEMLTQLRIKIQEKLPEPKFSQDVVKILNGISYLNLEALNTIEKNVKIFKKNQKSGGVNTTNLKTEFFTKNNENPSLMYKKLNKEKLTTIFKCLGFNMVYCPLIAEKIFINLSHLIQIKEEYDSGKFDAILSTVLIKQNTFYDLAKAVIKGLTGTKCRIRKYFNLSYLIISKSIPIVILLGGTSGTGKSTVSSLLASRLGISTVLSTDTIRHIMRNFLSKEEVPVLFASTYEAWKFIPSIAEESNKASNSILSMNKKILKGYCEQSRIVGDKLVKVIENILRRQESVIIEGVHLTVDNIKAIMKMHKYTFPFLVYIEKAQKHKERFAVRSRLMTLDARYNKYVEHFEYIRTIQSYLVKKSDRLLLPKIDNTNVDKSIGMIQETILRSFKDIYQNNISNYDESNDMLSNYFNNFSKLSKNLLSSKEAGVLISQKVNKNFLFEKYFNEKDESEKKDNLVPSVKENLNLVNNTQQNNCILKINTISNSLNKKQENYNYINSLPIKKEENNINNISSINNLNIISNICNTGKLIEEMINSTNDINLSRKLGNNIKKECLSDDEVVSYHKNSLSLKNESEIEAKKSMLNNGNSNHHRSRLNYQMENFKGKRDLVSNINTSPTVKVEKRFSMNTSLRRRKRQESEDKESNTNRSASLYKLGSVDSESVIERIKVINETEDEFDSIEADQEEYSRSK
jgi:2-phosphoglycerate kinase